MKQLVLAPIGAPSVSPTGLAYNQDGTVTLNRPPKGKGLFTLRCIGCQHLEAREFSGIRRCSCCQGHFRNSTGQYRWYSTHELLVPSRELAAIARGCLDHYPTAGLAV